jgi:hypothetical protein
VDFLRLGYYIVEPAPKPQHCKLNCGQILTVSDCICILHPNLKGSYWDNYEDEESNYQKRLGLSDESFIDMKATVSQLVDARNLEIDSRFANLSDAISFYNKYMRHLTNLRIVSIALGDAFKDVLINALNGVSCNLTSMVLNDVETDGNLLGYDILGWDLSSFHSYVCNSLENDISAVYPLKVDSFGIIQNQYDECIKIAEYIRGKGEPVDWLPFAMYEYPRK